MTSTSPVVLVAPPDKSGRLFIVDQIGLIRVLDGGALRDAAFLDVRSKIVPLSPTYDERGLLGIALHPQFGQNKKLYIFYSAPLRASAPTNFNCTSHLSEFKMKDADEVDV